MINTSLAPQKIIFTLLGIIICMLWGTNIIHAQAQLVNAVHDINLQIQDNDDILVNHKINLVNNSRDLISKYDLRLPFDKVSIVSVKLNNRTLRGTLVNNLLTVNFGTSILRSGNSTNLEITYKLAGGIKQVYGLKSLTIPKISSEYDLAQVKLTFTYPQSYPALAYVSFVNQTDAARTLTTDQHGNILILWGEELKFALTDSFSFTKQEDATKQFLYNLPYQSSQQTVVYDTYDLPGEIGSDPWANLWYVNRQPEDIVYQTQIKVTRASQSNQYEKIPNYPLINIPENLISNNTNQRNQIGELYRKIIQTKSPIINEVNTTDLGNLSYQTDLTSLQYASLLSGYLQGLGISHRVNYGYIVFDLPIFPEQVPHVWVEVVQDNNWVVVDPYLADVTGYNYEAVTPLDRFAMGVWNPNISIDSVLGLWGNGGWRVRPQLNELTVAETSSSEAGSGVTLGSAIPESGFTFQPYPVKLTIQNNTDQIWAVNEFRLDGESFLERMRQDGFLIPVTKPMSSREYTFEYTFPRLIFEGVQTHNLVIIGSNQNLEKQYTVNYFTNIPILIGILVSVLLVIVLIVVFLWRNSHPKSNTFARFS